jgi:hypothetical protein
VELIFEPGSRLTQIGNGCFTFCFLISICVPRSVQVLGESCFDGGTVQTLTFEAE